MKSVKMTVKVNELKRDLALLSKVVRKNKNIPILEDFLFEVKNDFGLCVMTITGGDGDVGVTIRRAAVWRTGCDDLALTVPAAQLVKVLGACKGSEAELEFEVKEREPAASVDTGWQKATITDGAAVYVIPCNEADDYPKLCKFENATKFKITGEALMDGVKYGGWAIVTEKKELALRPLLGGMHMSVSAGGGCEFASTDGHALARYRRAAGISGESNCNFTIGKRAMDVLRLYVKPSDDIEAAYTCVNRNGVTASMAYFSLFKGRVSVTCRLMDGRYPNYGEVIPLESPIAFVVGKYKLIDAINAVGLAASGTDNEVTFNLNGSLHLSAEDKEAGKKASMEVEVEGREGDGIKIIFNYKILGKALAAMPGGLVRLGFKHSGRCVMINPNNYGEAQEDTLALVMPCIRNQYT